MGKILAIEGTDCSGKETQSKMLEKRLKSENIKADMISFPIYNSPTGKIVGGPFLGKEEILSGWFEETAPNVDWKVAALYYAADRRYHIKKILESKSRNDILILDRYVYSNMGYQIAKLKDKAKRLEGFKWIEELEFNLLELPIPDKVLFLHMPLEQQIIIKSKRIEKLDQNESDDEYNKRAEETYLEMAKLYNFEMLECVSDKRIKTAEEIHEEVYEHAKRLILK